VDQSKTAVNPNLGGVFFHFGFIDPGKPAPPGTDGNTPGSVGCRDGSGVVAPIPKMPPPPPASQPWDPNSQDAPAAAWTPQLNGAYPGVGTPYNSVASGYLIPARESGGHGGFLTKGASGTTDAPNEYTFYALEMYPFKDAVNGPRMAPVVDDVNVVYMRWDTGTIVEEEEVVDSD
jgi:hypothetical protein